MHLLPERSKAPGTGALPEEKNASGGVMLAHLPTSHIGLQYISTSSPSYIHSSVITIRYYEITMQMRSVKEDGKKVRNFIGCTINRTEQYPKDSHNHSEYQ